MRRYQITRHFIQEGIYLLTQISEYPLLESNMALSENKSEMLEIKTTGYVYWTELSLPNIKPC